MTKRLATVLIFLLSLTVTVMWQQAALAQDGPDQPSAGEVTPDP